MLDSIRRYAAAVSGISQMTRAGAEALVRDLSKRGIAQVGDVGQAAQDLLDRSLRSRQDLVRLIAKEVRRQVAALGFATRDDIEALRARVEHAERDAAEAAKRASATASASAPKTKAKPVPKPKAKPAPKPKTS